MIKPAWSKYIVACTEYFEAHRGTPHEIEFTRVRTLIDIFSIAWPEIEKIYDQLSSMIQTERSA